MHHFMYIMKWHTEEKLELKSLLKAAHGRQKLDITYAKKKKKKIIDWFVSKDTEIYIEHTLWFHDHQNKTDKMYQWLHI